MNKRLLLLAGLAFAAAAPLVAHAHGGVSVAISTPEFGFRLGAPFYGPVFAPRAVVVPAPVYVPPVFMPPPVVYAPAVVVPAPRIIYRAPVVVMQPRVVHPRGHVPPPRVVVPYGRERHDHEQYTHEAAYRLPPGQARRYAHSAQYQ
jgi:hypothetical protein